MKTLFGLPTYDLAVALTILLGLAVATVGWIAVRDRTMFRMGVRNLPRRGPQTVLVVTGLMLSTLITTAAFVTGDTIDHSLTKGSYDLFQRSDLDITWNGERDFDEDAGAATAAGQVLAGQDAVEALERAFADDAEIENFLPFLVQQAPVTDARTGLAIPGAALSGFDPERLAKVGGLRLTGGGRADITALGSGEVYLSRRAAKDLGARTGDDVSIHIQGAGHTYRVAGIVEDELASGVLGQSYSKAPGGVAMRLDELQRLLGQPDQVSSVTVALRGDVRSTVDGATAVRDRLQAHLDGDGKGIFVQADGSPAPDVTVEAAKHDSVRNGELAGNVFTTFFLVLGLFSIAAGVMLIFMIFVMLAAERRAEMGMARAVGAQRGHLVRAFIAEGMAYSLIAGVLGSVAGVLASLGLTVGMLRVVGGEYFSIVEPSLTAKSIVIGYSLGVVMTFVTVVFASLKVTHVNIVAAIRNLDEEGKHGARRTTRWAWVAIGVPALALPPVGLWFILRKGFGISKGMIFAPAGIALGVLGMVQGMAADVLFPFALGISLVPLCGAVIARRLGTPARATWTATGLLLLAYWLIPAGLHEDLFGQMSSDIEMFLISGIMICIAFTLTIVFNARMLTSLFTRSHEGPAAYLNAAILAIAGTGLVTTAVAIGDGLSGLGQVTFVPAGLLLLAALLAFASARYPQIAPAMKMAVAYPLSNRFRTGMTIAMFSLIVFSLTVFSILNANFTSSNTSAGARAHLDIVSTIAATSPVTEVKGAAQAAGVPEARNIAGEGGVSIGTGMTFVRQMDRAQEWEPYAIRAADDPFLTTLGVELEARAVGYTSDAAVLAAVRDTRNLAVVDRGFVGLADDGTPGITKGVELEDGHFAPFDIQVIDATSGNMSAFTVIGVLKSKLTADLAGGVYLGAEGYRAAGFGEPSFQQHFLRLEKGADARETAAALQSALATQGVGAESLQVLLEERAQADQTFVRMFQAFMALGLLVGIAGLGVIAFRSVVERRQQIGMLRAIGFQRTTVSLTFMLESGFIAAMGILAGVVGGAFLGRNLMTSDDFTGGTDLAFALPWVELGVVIGATMLAALLMTWLPSRGAARVPVAEALRYE